MRRERTLKLALWLSGLLLALWLLFQLAVMVFDGTEITVDLKRQEVAAQTTLGDLNCRKELKAAFPFFTLRCKNSREASE